MNQSTLLTDSGDPQITEALAQLDAWRAVVVPSQDVARAIGHERGLRAVYVTAESPPTLREIVECPHAKGLPVIVG